jgi:hypothetical protein
MRFTANAVAALGRSTLPRETGSWLKQTPVGMRPLNAQSESVTIL